LLLSHRRSVPPPVPVSPDCLQSQQVPTVWARHEFCARASVLTKPVRHGQTTSRLFFGRSGPKWPTLSRFPGYAYELQHRDLEAELSIRRERPRICQRSLPSTQKASSGPTRPLRATRVGATSGAGVMTRVCQTFARLGTGKKAKDRRTRGRRRLGICAPRLLICATRSQRSHGSWARKVLHRNRWHGI